MGNCHNSDTSSLETSEKLDLLIEENLDFMKGLYLRFLELELPGAGLKLMKIHEHTKAYYTHNRSAREELIGRNGRLTRQEYSLFEKSLIQELDQLKKTNAFVKKQFKSLNNLWTVPNSKQLLKYISQVEDEYSGRLNKLSKAFSRHATSNVHIDVLANQVNGGNKLQESEEEFIRNLCKVTTYVFNDSTQKIDYPTKAKKVRADTLAIDNNQINMIKRNQTYAANTARSRIHE